MPGQSLRRSAWNAGDANQGERCVDEPRRIERRATGHLENRRDDRVVTGDRREVQREDTELAAQEQPDLRVVIELVGVDGAMTHREQRRDEEHAEHDAEDRGVGARRLQRSRCRVQKRKAPGMPGLIG